MTPSELVRVGDICGTFLGMCSAISGGGHRPFVEEKLKTLQGRNDIDLCAHVLAVAKLAVEILETNHEVN